MIYFSQVAKCFCLQVASYIASINDKIIKVNIHAFTDCLTHFQIKGVGDQTCRGNTITAEWSSIEVRGIGVARGGQGRAFALPSLSFALPSKPSSYLNMNCT